MRFLVYLCSFLSLFSLSVLCMRCLLLPVFMYALFEFTCVYVCVLVVYLCSCICVI